MARRIPPKGLPTASNGAPPKTGKPRIPENSAKRDRGAARATGPYSARTGSGTSAPKRASNAPTKRERGVSLGGQRMRERGARGYKDGYQR